MAGDEKKIFKSEKQIQHYLDEIEKYKYNLNGEKNNKNIEKINKKIDAFKAYTLIEAKKLEKVGGSTENYVKNLSDTQLEILTEIFPQGFGEEKVIKQRDRDAIIRKWKRWIEKLVELEEKYPPYDKNLSVKEKLNSKIYKQEKDIGYYMIVESDCETKNYNEIWNYGRDFETSTEFSEEERKIIERCIEVGKEYQVYWLKKFAFIDKIAEKVTGEKQYTAKEVAEITYKKIIPGYLEECYEKDSLTEDEIKNKSRELTRGIYDILVDEKRRTQLMAERDRIIEEKFKPQMKDMGIVGKIAFNKKEEIAIIFFLVLEELGPEEAIYAQMCYDGRNSDVESMKKALETFSLEEILQQ